MVIYQMSFWHKVAFQQMFLVAENRNQIDRWMQVTYRRIYGPNPWHTETERIKFGPASEKKQFHWYILRLFVSIRFELQRQKNIGSAGAKGFRSVILLLDRKKQGQWRIWTRDMTLWLNTPNCFQHLGEPQQRTSSLGRTDFEIPPQAESRWNHFHHNKHVLCYLSWHRTSFPLSWP